MQLAGGTVLTVMFLIRVLAQLQLAATGITFLTKGLDWTTPYLSGGSALPAGILLGALTLWAGLLLPRYWRIQFTETARNYSTPDAPAP